MTGVYFVSTNNQKVGRVIVENPHVTFWYVEMGNVINVLLASRVT